MLAAAITATAKDGGWATLAEVDSCIVKNSPSFDPRNYGFQKLGKLVCKQSFLKVKEMPAGDGSANVHLYVRIKKKPETNPHEEELDTNYTNSHETKSSRSMRLFSPPSLPQSASDRHALHGIHSLRGLNYLYMTSVRNVILGSSRGQNPYPPLGIGNGWLGSLPVREDENTIWMPVTVDGRNFMNAGGSLGR